MIPTSGQNEAPAILSVSDDNNHKKELVASLTWRLHRHVNPILRPTSHIEIVEDLLKPPLVAPNRRIHTAPMLPQRLLDLHSRIRLIRARHDALAFQELVAIQPLEQVYGFLEIIHNFFLRGVVVVAFGVEGADAGAVFVPFVFPEALVVAGVVFPILGHVF